MQSAHMQDDSRNRFIPIGNPTPQAQAALNLQSNTMPQMATNSTSDSLKDLLGFQGNLAGDMMPVFASRLLDLIKNNVQPDVHKPIYDMKIQKDIHELQVRVTFLVINKETHLTRCFICRKNRLYINALVAMW